MNACKLCQSTCDKTVLLKTGNGENICLFCLRECNSILKSEGIEARNADRVEAKVKRISIKEVYSGMRATK